MESKSGKNFRVYFNKQMINLTELKQIGKGTNRSCYLHPTNNNLCIKITHSNDFSEMKKEIKYYKQLFKQKISWENIARYHGSIMTNQGKGELFDLVKDYDGEVSKTLSYYLQNAERTQTILNPLELLKDLKNYTLNELIVVKDLNTKNMLYQKMSPNEAKLVLIDGVSNNDYLPFSLYIQFFTRRKILRLWKRFENSLPQKYAFNEYFINLLNQKI